MQYNTKYYTAKCNVKLFYAKQHYKHELEMHSVLLTTTFTDPYWRIPVY